MTGRRSPPSSNPKLCSLTESDRSIWYRTNKFLFSPFLVPSLALLQVPSNWSYGPLSPGGGPGRWAHKKRSLIFMNILEYWVIIIMVPFRSTCSHCAFPAETNQAIISSLTCCFDFSCALCMAPWSLLESPLDSSTMCQQRLAEQAHNLPTRSTKFCAPSGIERTNLAAVRSSRLK